MTWHMVTRTCGRKKNVDRSPWPRIQSSVKTRVTCVDLWKHIITLFSFIVYTQVENISQNETWFIVRGKGKTNSHSNKPSYLLDTTFLRDLPRSQRESFQVLPWSPCDSLVIAMWFSDDFHLIPDPLSSNMSFQNTSHKLLLSIFQRWVIGL